MRARASFTGESFTRDRKMVLSFAVEGVAVTDLDGLSGPLLLEVKPYKEKRSLSANAYFWQLCSQMAAKLRSTKEAVYLLMLRDAGQFIDVEVVPEAVEMLQRVYRYTEVMGESNRVMVRCYLGSSGYNTEEMSALIDHTVEEAKALGIETMTPNELAQIKSSWKGDSYGY